MKKTAKTIARRELATSQIAEVLKWWAVNRPEAFHSAAADRVDRDQSRERIAEDILSALKTAGLTISDLKRKEAKVSEAEPCMVCGAAGGHEPDCTVGEDQA